MLCQYNPGHILLAQAEREVFSGQLELDRLAATLADCAARTLALQWPISLTPLSFPLWVDRLRAQLSTEDWKKRMQRAAAELELRIADEPMRLYADRALYWPARQRRLIADLHLGKSDIFRRAGIAAAHGGTAHDLARLGLLIAHSGARELWILGDVLHTLDTRRRAARGRASVGMASPSPFDPLHHLRPEVAKVSSSSRGLGPSYGETATTSVA